MNNEQRREFQRAMDDATSNPRDILDNPIPGLPADPIDLRAYLMWLNSRWDRGNGAQFREQARRSFEAWAKGADELESWRD